MSGGTAAPSRTDSGLRSRQVELASRPLGWPSPANFRIADVLLPSPAPDQILVRNILMSVDPYMRARMNDVESYVPPFQLDEALDGGAIGQVLESQTVGVRVGDFVLHSAGWREHAVIDAGDAQVVDPGVAPLGAYLGVLGMTGMTAYAGLYKVAEFRSGDTVWVSGAAGAVGQIAGQLAKLGGAARVIGSVGSAAKVALLIEQLGFDAAFDYHAGPVRDQLAAAAPNGLDVYFDNVGGEHLEAAIAAANPHARFVLCGASSTYNAAAPPAAPRNLALIVTKRLQLRGMLVRDIRADFLEDVSPLVRDGRLRYDETVFDGLQQAPAAFLAMLAGETTGKTLVRLAS